MEVVRRTTPGHEPFLRPPENTSQHNPLVPHLDQSWLVPLIVYWEYPLVLSKRGVDQFAFLDLCGVILVNVPVDNAATSAAVRYDVLVNLAVDPVHIVNVGLVGD